MHWERGFRRLRLVGSAAMGLGLVLLLSVILTQALGYAPDAAYVPLFGALWPLGLMLVVLGALLWLAVWVLMGFLPVAPTEKEPARARPESSPESRTESW